MNVGKTLFAQLMAFVPWTSFGRIVQRYAGDAGVRSLTCAEQFRAMAFAQLTWHASLSANAPKLYAMGFRSAGRTSSMRASRSAWSWTTPATRWTPARSTCGGACSTGRIEQPRPATSDIRSYS